MNIRRFIVMGALAAAVLAVPGVAHADETHSGPDQGHRVALVSIGQIDDPMEDVLEHVAILGHNSVVGS
ncbi:hypothetical protein [Streptomyces gobitricini]|uniref:Secreted protein n=1 Tax=Streptomyces gobitricini TaxID=68211 RepID=A0ABN3MWJ2_9ACTN